MNYMDKKNQNDVALIQQKKFIDYLTNNDLKLTKARSEVFEIVAKMDNHFGAEDILQSSKNSVSRATLYRTLNELVESQVIRKTAFGDKHQHFEFVLENKPHHHAFCLNCKTNIEFPDFGEEEIYNKILEKMGFEIYGHEMHFYGLCKNCIKEKI